MMSLNTAMLVAKLAAGIADIKSSSAPVVAVCADDTTSGMTPPDSVPGATKAAILQFGGNDGRRGITRQQRQAHLASIQQQLRARGVKTAQADAYVKAVSQAGIAQSDRVHFSVDGHKRGATQLVGSIR